MTTQHTTRRAPLPAFVDAATYATVAPLLDQMARLQDERLEALARSEVAGKAVAAPPSARTAGKGTLAALVEVTQRALHEADLADEFDAASVPGLDGHDLKALGERVQARLQENRMDEGPAVEADAVRVGVALRCLLFVAGVVRYLDQMEGMATADGPV